VLLVLPDGWGLSAAETAEPPELSAPGRGQRAATPHTIRLHPHIPPGDNSRRPALPSAQIRQT